MTAWCTRCGDEFSPVEGAEVPLDPDEPRFCSYACEDAWSDLVDAEEAYYETRGGAPVPP